MSKGMPSVKSKLKIGNNKVPEGPTAIKNDSRISWGVNLYPIFK
jgi:hypothetical protein